MVVTTLGDASNLKMMIMTHTRFAVIKANWHADIVGQALDELRAAAHAARAIGTISAALRAA